MLETRGLKANVMEWYAQGLNYNMLGLLPVTG